MKYVYELVGLFFGEIFEFWLEYVYWYESENCLDEVVEVL